MDTSRTLGHALFRRWVDTFESQEAAGTEIGCSQVSVSNIYRGKQQPRMELLIKIREKSVSGPDGAIPLDAWATRLTDEEWDKGRATGTDG